MDSKEDTTQLPGKEILREYKKMIRQERYLYEKDKGRLVRFNEEYHFNSSNTIEDLISERNLHRALHKALSELDKAEYEIIQEYFFSDEKVTYEELSKKHSIARQVYTRKVKRILAKLKVLVVSHYEEF